MLSSNTITNEHMQRYYNNGFTYTHRYKCELEYVVCYVMPSAILSVKHWNSYGKFGWKEWWN